LALPPNVARAFALALAGVATWPFACALTGTCAATLVLVEAVAAVESLAFC
jgi:hypothetical protein